MAAQLHPGGRLGGVGWGSDSDGIDDMDAILNDEPQEGGSNEELMSKSEYVVEPDPVADEVDLSDLRGVGSQEKKKKKKKSPGALGGGEDISEHELDTLAELVPDVKARTHSTGNNNNHITNHSNNNHGTLANDPGLAAGSMTAGSRQNTHTNSLEPQDGDDAHNGKGGKRNRKKRGQEGDVPEQKPSDDDDNPNNSNDNLNNTNTNSEVGSTDAQLRVDLSKEPQQSHSVEQHLSTAAVNRSNEESGVVTTTTSTSKKPIPKKGGRSRKDDDDDDEINIDSKAFIPEDGDSTSRHLLDEDSDAYDKSESVIEGYVSQAGAEGDIPKEFLSDPTGVGASASDENFDLQQQIIQQQQEDKIPLTLPDFKPATGCTNASDFTVRCFMARLRAGITVVKHGRARWCKSRLRDLHIHPDGRSLGWEAALGEPSSPKRSPKYDLTSCLEVRHAWSPDPLNPMYTGTPILRQKCEAANAHKSFALIFKHRTVDITAVTADQCKVLMEGFSALIYRLKLAYQYGAIGSASNLISNVHLTGIASEQQSSSSQQADDKKDGSGGGTTMTTATTATTTTTEKGGELSSLPASRPMPEEDGITVGWTPPIGKTNY